METDNIKINILFIAAASIVFIEGAAIFLSSGRHLNSLIIIGIVRLLEIITIISAVIIWGKGLPSIGLDPSTTIRGIKKGLLWSFIFGMAAGFIFLILYFAGKNPLAYIHSQLPEKNKDIFIFLGIGCIVGPIAEELFFRGILYGFFRRWGIPAALIFTTILFVLAHYNTVTIPVIQIAGGIIFAVAYEIEKSLIVPIIIHILGNSAIYILPFIM
ncbi:MAG: type II CAAX endopeptidase family protein [Desulfobacteraceae bacterium]|jgi:membrane protease YdiL (CAAX protease family)